MKGGKHQGYHGPFKTEDLAMKFNAEKFKNFIKQREDIRITGLAKMLGVSRGCVYKWMEGNTFPQKAYLKRLERLYGRPRGFFEDDLQKNR